MNAGACGLCGSSLAGQRRDARFCSVKHRSAHGVRERAKQRLLKRPRCMICGKPLNPQWRGFTCSRKCAYTRWNWFRRGR